MSVIIITIENTFGQCPKLLNTIISSIPSKNSFNVLTIAIKGLAHLHLTLLQSV